MLCCVCFFFMLLLVVVLFIFNVKKNLLTFWFPITDGIDHPDFDSESTLFLPHLSLSLTGFVLFHCCCNILKQFIMFFVLKDFPFISFFYFICDFIYALALAWTFCCYPFFCFILTWEIVVVCVCTWKSHGEMKNRFSIDNMKYKLSLTFKMMVKLMEFHAMKMQW